ncbi:DEAD/DEAH box helicase [Malacoplasma penetrans]|uniref:Hypothetical ATP/GTP-binding protein n=1 Tax=Malacoplasma penetrans (strain HF-2) TaxID=272633 RepID=Q8EVT0_MALP2|nr:DEAD/DEAH box helicase family protein [Malacoplasma penetrans]RXY97266.1 DEAD/DEAH box helicase [Malacoplasma penetrans]BAC44269.1 hypothetical ATP/GTP-binding protein [Malacoplasma penetrans HF-2]
MELTSVQNKAVKKIVNYYIENKEKFIYFNAPTGSGKTFMIANVISEILNFNLAKNKKSIFIVFTLSQAELPVQFDNKLKDYQKNLSTKFESIYQDSPSNTNIKSPDNEFDIKYEGYDVLVFGTSSFGKNRKFSELGKFKALIEELKNKGFEIIYIRDEAHIGDKRKNTNDGLDEQKLVIDEASFVIKMTATPDFNNNGANVFIKEKDLNNDDNNCYLLKTNHHWNINFESDIIDDDIILDTAIKTFKDIKNKYNIKSKESGKIINPAMLIQISSKNQFNEEIKESDKRID